MTKILPILFILAAGQPVDAAEVSICKLYDNRLAADVETVDDVATNSIQDFIEYTDAARSNGMIVGWGVIAGRMDAESWATLQTQIDLGGVEICNHSMNHTNPDTISTGSIPAQVTSATTLLKSELTLPWQFRYNGSNYITSWLQPWGSGPDEYHDIIRPVLATDGYLSDRNTSTTYDDFVEWDSAEGLYERFGSAYTGETLSLHRSWLIGHAGVVNGVYGFYDHPAYTSVTVTNGSWRLARMELIGNRTNIWYTGPNGLYSYRYAATRASVAIADTGLHGRDIRFESTIPQNERDMYGLSYPLTYEVSLPSGYSACAGVTAEAQWGTNEWTKLTEYTSSDLFNGINGYRWDSTSNRVFVSYGFPQTGTNFSIRIRPKSMRLFGDSK